MREFLQEVKRRNVFRVAIVYIIAGWLTMQVVDVMFPALNIPPWVTSLVAALLLIPHLIDPGDIKAEINRAITPGEYRGYYYEDDYHRKPMAFRLDKPDSPVFLLKLPDDSAPILFARE